MTLSPAHFLRAGFLILALGIAATVAGLASDTAAIIIGAVTFIIVAAGGEALTRIIAKWSEEG